MGGSNFEVSFESEDYWTGMLGKGFKGGAKVDEDTVGTHPSVSICNADGKVACLLVFGGGRRFICLLGEGDISP